MVYLLDGELRVTGRFPVGAQVNWVSAPATGDKALIVAATEDGRVVGLRD
jgi:hypothetical protein